MVDYGELVMKAVSSMLKQRGVKLDGLSAATHKGDDRSLAGKVQGMRAWLSEMDVSTGLQVWDSEHLVGLPHYDKSWGTSRNKSMWSPEWSSFHDRHIFPLEQEARGKRQKVDDAIGLDVIETLLGDDNGDRRFDGDVFVDGTVHASMPHRARTPDYSRPQAGLLLARLSLALDRELPHQECRPGRVVQGG